MAATPEAVQKLIKRIEALEQSVATVVTAETSFQNRVQALEAGSQTIANAEASIQSRLQALEAGGQKRQETKPFTETKGFQSLLVYDGKPSEYERWSFLLQQRLVKYNDDYTPIFDWLGGLSVPPDDAALEEFIMNGRLAREVVKPMTRIFWDVVCEKTGEKVATVVQNAERLAPELRGLVVLQKLHQEAMGMTGDRAEALTNLVLSPSRVEQLADLGAMLRRGKPTSEN